MLELGGKSMTHGVYIRANKAPEHVNVVTKLAGDFKQQVVKSKTHHCN